MTSKTIQLIGLAFAMLTIAATILGAVVDISRRQGSIDESLVQLKSDVAGIKAKFDLIAPPTVRPVGNTAELTPTPIVVKASSDDDDEPQSAEGWHQRYLKDKCDNCPECCASASTGAP